MAELRFRPAARTDLAALAHYIFERSGSGDVALGYFRRLRARCEQLRVFPKVGRARDDLRPGVRIISFERRVVIAYMILPSGDVEIGRFFYGGRDYEALLRGQDESEEQ